MVRLAPPLFVAPLPAAASAAADDDDDGDGTTPTPRRAAYLPIVDDARAANMIVCMMGCGATSFYFWGDDNIGCGDKMRRVVPCLLSS
jgi:hypothetical protein